MSTRVLPDPAGAITRAGPASWYTAAVCSRSSAAIAAAGRGYRVEPPRVDGLGVDAPPPGERADVRGPPSIQAAVPSGRVTSTGPAGLAPASTALCPHHHTGSPPRAS